jgi:putative transposase
LLGLVEEKRKIWKRGSGRNLLASLKNEIEKHQIKIGRDKFFDFLRKHQLLIKPKRYRTKTTCSYHHFNRYDYLIKDQVPSRANEIWVSDITYIWLKELDKFCYLSMITDLYSRKIVGYCVHEDLSVKGCEKALKMALKQRNDKLLSLTHHSDRGVQYCSHSYVNLLKKNNIAISMTQTGDPLENAVAERINKTIKEEFTQERQLSFSNISEAKKEIKRYIDFYNQERPHRSIEMLTPAEAHLKTGFLERKWKTNYRKMENDNHYLNQ